MKILVRISLKIDTCLWADLLHKRFSESTCLVAFSNFFSKSNDDIAKVTQYWTIYGDSLGGVKDGFLNQQLHKVDLWKSNQYRKSNVWGKFVG